MGCVRDVTDELQVQVGAPIGSRPVQRAVHLGVSRVAEVSLGLALEV